LEYKPLGIVSEGEPRPDSLEIVLVGNRTNKHFHFRFDSRHSYKFNYGGTEYKVEKDCLLKSEKSLIDKLKRVRNSYIIFFKEGEAEPIRFDFNPPRVSARILYFAVQSRTLNKGLASVFKRQFAFGIDFKTIIFIVFIAIVGGVLYHLWNIGVLSFG